VPDVDEWSFTLSFFMGLVGGLAVLRLGVTSAMKAARSGRKTDVQASMFMYAAMLPKPVSADSRRDPMATAFRRTTMSDTTSTYGDADMSDPLRPLKLVIQELNWKSDSVRDDWNASDDEANEWGMG
jgi:hypothetical protein